jgi:hypothetical protein
MRIASFLLASLASVSLAFAQQQTPPQGYMTVIPQQNLPSDGTASTSVIGPAVTPLPLWNYSLTSPIDGGLYNGTIVGRSPYNRSKGTTTIPTQIIPLIITINGGTPSTHTYDPTASDACITGPNIPYTPLSVITGSPIFTTNTWTMNGVNVGNTQYIDAFQRAEFWSLLGGTPYHLMLNQSTLPAQALTLTGTNYDALATFGGCGFVGVVNINSLDAAVHALITGPLAAMVNAGTFPIFLTNSVVSAETGHSIFSSCCVLGYHSAFTSAGNLQIYSPFSLDTSGTFGNGDVSTLAHEMGEAINDPTGNNPTPKWGNEGQVGSACQNNFEVGDPLSPGFSTPTNPFIMVGANGLTYHLQELAFFSWFYGGASLGTGGKFSNNGTFGGAAKLCPPGGTN